jgi:NADH:ubiquinone oxidoreductase subunit 2 (subunit N)
VSAIFSALAGLRAKNLYNIFVYSAIQNNSILILPPIAAYSNNLNTTVILYIFQYLFVTSLFLKSIQSTNIVLKKYTLFGTLLSVAGIPPLLGFYCKILVLFSLITNYYYTLFTLLVILNLISFCFYGKILIQKLLDLKYKVNIKNKIYKLLPVVISSLFLFIS